MSVNVLVACQYQLAGGGPRDDCGIHADGDNIVDRVETEAERAVVVPGLGRKARRRAARPVIRCVQEGERHSHSIRDRYGRLDLEIPVRGRLIEGPGIAGHERDRVVITHAGGGRSCR